MWLRIDRPLCPGSITITGRVAVAGWLADDRGAVDDGRPDVLPDAVADGLGEALADGETEAEALVGAPVDGLTDVLTDGLTDGLTDRLVDALLARSGAGAAEGTDPHPVRTIVATSAAAGTTESVRLRRGGLTRST